MARSDTVNIFLSRTTNTMNKYIGIITAALSPPILVQFLLNHGTKLDNHLICYAHRECIVRLI